MLSRITQRQLEYFVASGEAGSISAASERIHVSSPSISAAITHMEAELGIQLFVRHHAQGISLTAVGRQVMQEAKLILEQMTNLYTIASESLNTVRGPLRVGCLEWLAPMITPELVFGFGRAFPGVRLTQVEGNHEEMLEKLRSAEIDIALTYDLVTSDDIDFQPLAQLPPYVMVGEYHPLASLSAVSMLDLEDYPVVLLDTPWSREYFLSFFMQAGTTPNIIMRSSNLPGRPRCLHRRQASSHRKAGKHAAQPAPFRVRTAWASKKLGAAMPGMYWSETNMRQRSANADTTRDNWVLLAVA
jgi:DNA-binding transcriptional LysR family regulator